jgi:hypothetical protein
LEELRVLLGVAERGLGVQSLALEQLRFLLKDLGEARRGQRPEPSGTGRGLRLPVY